VLQTSLAHPDLTGAKVAVPEGRTVLREVGAAADALYVKELDDGIYHILRVPSDGAPARLPIPIAGTVSMAGSDPRLDGIIFSETSWTTAARYCRYVPVTGQVVTTNLQPAGPYDNLDDLTSEEVKAPSYDGTMIPLSIVHKKGMALDGKNPTILYAYGSYGITQDPALGPSYIAWYERGGIFAVAHVRGGGEGGEAWHQGGFKLTKPNTWRDFIACGEYLVRQKYTSPAQMAVMGGSAGGITVGRAITERPDLFAAASARSGVVDALRAEREPNGPPNVPEFGSSRTQAGFEDLYAMDALQHVRDGVAYPAVLLTTGINDPRVSPSEPAKFAARLQAASSSGKPVLLRVDYQGGHGIGASRLQSEELTADTFAFFLWQFAHAPAAVN
jgi:prolyl oligopeptidase